MEIGEKNKQKKRKKRKKKKKKRNNKKQNKKKERKKKNKFFSLIEKNHKNIWKWKLRSNGVVGKFKRT